MTSSLPTDQEVGRAWTAYIVGELFEAWPRRCDFSALDLGRATGVSARNDEEELFDDLAKWLLDNGFIRFDQASEGAAYGVALTEKGFAVLGRNAPGTERPLGAKLKEAATGAGKDAARATLASLIGVMVSVGVAAIKP